MSMASSSTSSRNSLCPVRLSRRMVTLCWMSGWSKTYSHFPAVVVRADSGMARWSSFSPLACRLSIIPCPLSLTPPSSFEVHHLVDPSLMAPAFKGGLEEDAHDVLGDLGPGDALPQGDRIGVVMRAGQPGRGRVVTQRAANTKHLVRHHGLAIPRAAQHDGPVGLAARHGLGRRDDEVRVVHGALGVRAEVPHFVSQLADEK